MPKEVEVEGIGTVEFPDMMTSRQMAKAIKTKFIPRANKPQTLKEVVSQAGGFGEFLIKNLIGGPTYQTVDTQKYTGKPIPGVPRYVTQQDIPTPNVAGMTVYHGSPHVFDKFDMSKIGTGEGAQTFGHGLYFAQTPEVASTYKGRGAESSGVLYSADLPDDQIAKMLDWDKPLSEQPDIEKKLTPILAPYIQKALLYGKKVKPIPEMTGEEINRLITAKEGFASNASDRLRGLGIPGIKYLDQGSRTAGSGTHNFVVFDDVLIKDVKRQ